MSQQTENSNSQSRAASVMDVLSPKTQKGAIGVNVDLTSLDGSTAVKAPQAARANYQSVKYSASLDHTSLDSFVSNFFLKCVSKPSTGVFCPWAGEVALMFVDMSGYSKITADLAPFGPHAMFEAVNGYFERIVALTTEFEGDVLTFAGDAMVAVWYKFSHQQNCELACRCALELQERCGSHKVERTEHSFTLHVGVSAGHVGADVFWNPHSAKNMQEAYLFVGGHGLVSLEPLVNASKSHEICVASAVVEAVGKLGTVVESTSATESTDSKSGKTLDDGDVIFRFANYGALNKEENSDDDAGEEMFYLTRPHTPSLTSIEELKQSLTSSSLPGEGELPSPMKQLPPSTVAPIKARLATFKDLPNERKLESKRTTDIVRRFVQPHIIKKLSSGQTATQMAEQRLLGVLFIKKRCTAPVSTWFAELQKILDDRCCPIVQCLEDDKGIHVIAAHNLFTSEEDVAMQGLLSCRALLNHGVECYVGFSVGLVFCGVVGSDIAARWDITGETCVRACRLMQLAEDVDEPVLIDDTAFDSTQYISEMSLYESELMLKGWKQPSRCYCLAEETVRATGQIVNLGKVCEGIHPDAVKVLRAGVTEAESIVGAGIVTGEYGSGKKTVCLRAIQGTKFVPFLHQCTRTGAKLLLGQSLAEWFENNEIEELRKLSRQIKEAMAMHFTLKAHRLCMKLIQRTVQLGQRTACIVSHVEIADKASLALIRESLEAADNDSELQKSALIAKSLLSMEGNPAASTLLDANWETSVRSNHPTTVDESATTTLRERSVNSTHGMPVVNNNIAPASAPPKQRRSTGLGGTRASFLVSTERKKSVSVGGDSKDADSPKHKPPKSHPSCASLMGASASTSEIEAVEGRWLWFLTHTPLYGSSGAEVVLTELGRENQDDDNDEATINDQTLAKKKSSVAKTTKKHQVPLCTLWPMRMKTTEALWNTNAAWLASDSACISFQEKSGGNPACMMYVWKFMRKTTGRIMQLKKQGKKVKPIGNVSSNGVMHFSEEGQENLFGTSFFILAPDICAKIQQQYDCLPPHLQMVLRVLAAANDAATGFPIALLGMVCQAMRSQEEADDAAELQRVHEEPTITHAGEDSVDGPPLTSSNAVLSPSAHSLSMERTPRAANNMKCNDINDCVQTLVDLLIIKPVGTECVTFRVPAMHDVIMKLMTPVSIKQVNLFCLEFFVGRTAIDILALDHHTTSSEESTMTNALTSSPSENATKMKALFSSTPFFQNVPAFFFKGALFGYRAGQMDVYTEMLKKAWICIHDAVDTDGKCDSPLGCSGAPFSASGETDPTLQQSLKIGLKQLDGRVGDESIVPTLGEAQKLIQKELKRTKTTIESIPPLPPRPALDFGKYGELPVVIMNLKNYMPPFILGPMRLMLIGLQMKIVHQFLSLTRGKPVGVDTKAGPFVSLHLVVEKCLKNEEYSEQHAADEHDFLEDLLKPVTEVEQGVKNATAFLKFAEDVVAPLAKRIRQACSMMDEPPKYCTAGSHAVNRAIRLIPKDPTWHHFNLALVELSVVNIQLPFPSIAPSMMIELCAKLGQGDPLALRGHLLVVAVALEASRIFSASPTAARSIVDEPFRNKLVKFSPPCADGSAKAACEAKRQLNDDSLSDIPMV